MMVVTLLVVVVDTVNIENWVVVPDSLMHCIVAVAPMANSYLSAEHHIHAMGFQVECTHLKANLEEVRSILAEYLAYKLSHACCLS